MKIFYEDSGTVTVHLDKTYLINLAVMAVEHNIGENLKNEKINFSYGIALGDIGQDPHKIEKEDVIISLTNCSEKLISKLKSVANGNSSNS